MSKSPPEREGGAEDPDQGPEDLRSDSKKKAAGMQCWAACSTADRPTPGPLSRTLITSCVCVRHFAQLGRTARRDHLARHSANF